MGSRWSSGAQPKGCQVRVPDREARSVGPRSRYLDVSMDVIDRRAASDPWVLPPNEAGRISGRRADVLRLAREGLSTSGPLQIYTLFWLTALGFQTSGDDGFALLSGSYFGVYDAVMRSQYPSNAWDVLVPATPAPRFSWSSDRSRRLREALKIWLRRNPSFAQELANGAPTPHHADLVESLRN